MKPKPRRIAARPDPEAWSDTDPLSLEEAAALMFPDGPYTASTLRSCYRQGFLEVTILARKLTTNKRAIREMMEAARRPARKSGKIGAGGPAGTPVPARPPRFPGA